jgi:hypothetical protein
MNLGYKMEQPREAPRYAVIDIDGCVIDSGDRLHHLVNGNYQAYLDNHHTDKPINQGVWLVHALHMSGCKIVFNTSREEISREVTQGQLENFLPGLRRDFTLLMHKHKPGAPRDHAREKIWALAEAGIDPLDIFVAVDDKTSICDAYRNCGVVSWQLGPDWN